MSANSKIQWTDHTFNAWEGCTKVAPECKNCYAKTLVDHRFGRAKWGKGQPRRRTSGNLWKQPLAWNKTAPQRLHWGPEPCSAIHTGAPCKPAPRVFCLSLGDWLDEEVPIEWLSDLLLLIERCQNLDWQLLTKRPQNWIHRIGLASNLTQRKWLFDWAHGDYIPPNIWIGVSAGADQKAALEIPAKVHFLSCEPMLHALDEEQNNVTQEFDWIIFGGESGTDARPCHIEWIRRGLAFCRANGIQAFVKQLGRRPYFLSGAAKISMRTNRYRDFDDVIRDSHGGDMSEWPEDLRVREFPKLVTLETRRQSAAATA